MFSKKSHNAINVISAISVCGVALATMALVCTLSVFNGFQDLVANMFTAFDPQIRITPAEGKVFHSTDSTILSVRDMEEIDIYSFSLEDNAMVKYQDRQTMAVIKGVEDNFAQLTPIDSILFGRGNLVLHDEVANYAIPGIQLLSVLGSGVKFLDPLYIYAPKRGKKVNISNPAASFNTDKLFSSGLTFAVNQEKYDGSYIIAPISFARQLFNYTDEVSALNLKLKEGFSTDATIAKLKALLGNKYYIKDRYEQQEDTFKIMKIEKFISYLFLTFILMIACFNVIGSLSMLIIDKKNDVSTLRNLGATHKQIVHIFLYEGRMISFTGATTGIAIGVVLCLLQQEYGFIALGEAGSFIVDAYPVRVELTDVVIIFATVLAVGFVSVWYPVHYLSRKLLNNTTHKQR